MTCTVGVCGLWVVKLPAGGGKRVDVMKRRSLLFVLMYDVAVTFHRLYSTKRLSTASL
jgi:hypothetical protein